MNPFDKHLRNKLEEQKLPFKSEHLADFEALLDQRESKRKPFPFWILGVIVVLIGAVMFIYPKTDVIDVDQATSVISDTKAKYVENVNSTSNKAQVLGHVDSNANLSSDIQDPNPGAVSLSDVKSESERSGAKSTVQPQITRNQDIASQSLQQQVNQPDESVTQSSDREADQKVVTETSLLKINRLGQTGVSRSNQKTTDRGKQSDSRNQEEQLKTESQIRNDSQNITSNRILKNDENVIDSKGEPGLLNRQSIRALSQVISLGSRSFYVQEKKRDIAKSFQPMISSSPLIVKRSNSVRAGVEIGYGMLNSPKQGVNAKQLAFGGFVQKGLESPFAIRLNGGVSINQGGVFFKKTSSTKEYGFGLRSTLNTLDITDTYSIYAGAALLYRAKKHSIGVLGRVQYLYGAKGNITRFVEDDFGMQIEDILNDSWVEIDGLRKIGLEAAVEYGFQLLPSTSLSLKFVVPLISNSPDYSQEYLNQDYFIDSDRMSVYPEIKIRYSLIKF